MRVASVLQYAVDMGVLTLRTTRNESLERDLQDAFAGHCDFYVINNDQIVAHENLETEAAFRATMLARHAAEVVARRIADLLATPAGRKHDLVIANAGGISVSGIVQHLAAHKILPETVNPQRLLFLSLNSASMPADYGYSANTLAVRMAEIYGGRHIAVTPIWPKAVKGKYQQAIQDIDLLICGAGAQDGLLFHWLRHEGHIRLPEKAVGDICLIPISPEGQPLALEMNGPDQVSQVLHPNPSFQQLKALADRNGVIYVPRGYHDDDRPAGRKSKGTPRPTHSKLAVTRAILAGGLARTIVLGATLARDLLQAP